MIVEVRTYTSKPGCRDAFLALFQTRTKPLQQSLGMGIVGPFIHLDHADMFTWLRTFPSLVERDRMKSLLYEGDEWKGELEALAMPMLQDFSVVLTRTQDARAPSMSPKFEMTVEQVMSSIGVQERTAE